MRLFVAVDLAPAVLHRVEQLIAERNASAPRARWQRTEQLHVTLCFLGEVPESELPRVAERVRAAALRHAPFALELTSAGCFPDAARPRVLWLGVGGDSAALAALEADLRQSLSGFVSAPETRDYHPHLTLARSSQRGGDRQLAECIASLERAELGTSAIADIVLYSSHSSPAGVRYTAELRAPLEPRSH